MSTIDGASGEPDFYTQLTAEIEAGNIKQAVAMAAQLPERRSRIEVLSRLASGLDSALDIRGANTLDLNRARALLRARDRANELATAFKAEIDVDRARAIEPILESARALELALNRARALYLYLDRAEQINNTILGGLDDLMDKAHYSSTNIVTGLKPSPKSQSGRAVKIALVCIVLLAGVLTLMVLQSRSNARAAATSTAQAELQSAAGATVEITPTQ